MTQGNSGTKTVKRKPAIPISDRLCYAKSNHGYEIFERIRRMTPEKCNSLYHKCFSPNEKVLSPRLDRPVSPQQRSRSPSPSGSSGSREASPQDSPYTKFEHSTFPRTWRPFNKYGICRSTEKLSRRPRLYELQDMIPFAPPVIPLRPRTVNTSGSRPASRVYVSSSSLSCLIKLD